MMGGNFGSAAGAFLFLPLLIVILCIGLVIGVGAMALLMWVF